MLAQLSFVLLQLLVPAAFPPYADVFLPPYILLVSSPELVAASHVEPQRPRTFDGLWLPPDLQ